MSRQRPLIDRPLEEDPPPARPERPFLVTLAVVGDILFAGTVPIVILFLETRGALFLLPLPALLLGVGLPVTIILAASGTWRGKDRYRVALLFLLTIYYALQLIQPVSALLSTVGSASLTVAALSRIVRNAGWLLFNYWVFLRPGTIAYYRRPIDNENRSPS